MCAVTTFSPTRRHDAARALSRYVQGEVRGGRSLGDVLDDEDVRAAVTDSPEVLEDVTDDRELREALRPAVPSCTLGARALVGRSVAHRAISEHRVPVLIVPAGTPVAPTPAEPPLSATT